MQQAGLTTAGLTTAGLTTAGLTTAGLTTAGLTTAGLTTAGLTTAGLTTAGLTTTAGACKAHSPSHMGNSPTARGCDAAASAPTAVQRCPACALLMRQCIATSPLQADAARPDPLTQSAACMAALLALGLSPVNGKLCLGPLSAASTPSTLPAVPSRFACGSDAALQHSMMTGAVTGRVNCLTRRSRR